MITANWTKKRIFALLFIDLLALLKRAIRTKNQRANPNPA